MVSQRWVLHGVVVALIAFGSLSGRVQASPTNHHAPETAVCETYRITGYAATDYPGTTADGSTTTVAALSRGEWIAAASRNVPMGATIEIDGIGSYRVADRGYLDARHVDVLVATRAEAVALTSYRRACWWQT